MSCPGPPSPTLRERGTYDADATAALTLRELERWLTLAVATYHGSVHGALHQTPAARWAEGVAQSGRPPVVTHATAFLVDFLPVLRRTLTRTGFVIDHVRYFADALKPWIARRESPAAFLDSARPSGHQPGLGAGAGGPALPGGALPHLVPPGRSPCGSSARRWPGSGAGARASGRGRPVSHDRADARHRPGCAPDDPPERGATPSGGATSKTARPGAKPSPQASRPRNPRQTKSPGHALRRRSRSGSRGRGARPSTCPISCPRSRPRPACPRTSGFDTCAPTAGSATRGRSRRWTGWKPCSPGRADSACPTCC